MNKHTEPAGSIDVAIKHATSLLQDQPQLAAAQAQEVLKVVPGHPVATLLLGVARRSLGHPREAVAILAPLAATHDKWLGAHFELGLALGAAGRHTDAAESLHRAVQIEPALPDAWRALGDELTASGDRAGADAAYAQHIKASTNDPRLMSAAVALCENRIPQAEQLLRSHLKQFPTDVAAIRMFAEIAARIGRYGDAENLLARALELAPGFDAARHNYATVLYRQNKPAAALSQVDLLLAREPRNASYQNLRAAILARIGDYDESIDTYAKVLRDYPHNPKVWMSYGHALKTAGREQASIDAYRKSIELAPSFGEAYWSLANLKTLRFSAADVAAMQAQLQRTDIVHEDRLHLEFALGKALEDAANYAESFAHYAEGNRLRRTMIAYDAAETSGHVQRSQALYTTEFFAARRDYGTTAADPIFVVGLPRSGSTLVEQILASHSLIEGTMELPDIAGLARQLSGRSSRSQPSKYPEVLAQLRAADCRALGEQYLAQTRIQRKRSRPLFIDKMPNNFAHIGLIHMILPRAKIIDVRRHPLACCFSGFKQHFARGQNFTYSLEDIGHYYRDYVALLAHFDAVLPGRVHRVIYEQLVEDTEAEVRRLLEYCNIEFDPACLRFYENNRAVRTASSQQVRQPIFRGGIDQWRHFEPWLTPLKLALGPSLDVYPYSP
jgi:predicted Zn-dependent protease